MQQLVGAHAHADARVGIVRLPVGLELAVELHMTQTCDLRSTRSACDNIRIVNV